MPKVQGFWFSSQCEKDSLLSSVCHFHLECYVCLFHLGKWAPKYHIIEYTMNTQFVLWMMVKESHHDSILPRLKRPSGIWSRYFYYKQPLSFCRLIFNMQNLGVVVVVCIQSTDRVVQQWDDFYRHDKQLTRKGVTPFLEYYGLFSILHRC